MSVIKLTHSGDNATVAISIDKISSIRRLQPKINDNSTAVTAITLSCNCGWYVDETIDEILDKIFAVISAKFADKKTEV
ncbi:MAG: hypothetical protein RSB20_01605 [Clostridia bacterium]